MVGTLRGMRRTAPWCGDIRNDIPSSTDCIPFFGGLEFVGVRCSPKKRRMRNNGKAVAEEFPRPLVGRGNFAYNG